jgi:hypothetical protein
MASVDKINEKLDILLNKINDIDDRLKCIEVKTNDVHHFVPFVQYLENVSKKLVSMSYIPSLSYFTNDLPYIKK